MLDGLVHWNENTSRLDRCESGAAVGVAATGAAEEMKDGPKSPIEQHISLFLVQLQKSTWLSRSFVGIAIYYSINI